MAEKSFGIKELNLIGASGTPSIDSPNNLNLNAVNVAISTNVSIGGTLSVTGNVSIGGTLTYEDVTNIDSVGVITARNGIDCNGDIDVDGHTNLDNVSIAGITTFAQAINVLGSMTGQSVVLNAGSPTIFLNDTDTDSDFSIQCNGGLLKFMDTTNSYALRLSINSSGNVAIAKDLDVDGHTNLDNVSIAGVVTATTFSGSGASLTNLPLSNTDVQVLYTVTANGSSAYRFAGNGIVSTEDNPDVYLIRGLKYRFVNNSGGSHPFQIRESSGGSAYSAGVTNNGASSGNIDFQVPYSAPSHLYYQCTAHGGMVGNLYIRGAGGNNTNVGVTTFSGVVAVSGTTNLSSELRANGNIRITNAGPKITFVDSNNDSDFHIENADGSFEIRDVTNGADRIRIASDGTISTLSNVDMNIGTGEVDIYSTGSGDQLSLRLLNSDASAGNKIGIYFGPANNVAGAFIKGHAESDFTSAANRDGGLIFGTRLNGNFLEAMKISASGIVTKPSYHPAFRAGRSTDVNPGTNGTIVFNYVSNPTHFNQGGHYDNSTGAFTAPIAGVYNFYCQVLWESVGAGQNMADAFFFYYNASGGASGGTLVSYDARRAEYIAGETGNAGYYGAHTSLLIYMAANSSLYVRNYYNLTVHGNANFTFFQGHLVG